MKFGKRLGKAKSYLFEEFPFSPTPLDYNTYWDRITKEGLYTPNSYKFNLIANLIERRSSVLDIGCGDGSLLSHLSAKKEVDGFGIDISEKALQKARSRGLRVAEVDISKEEFPLGRAYDYVVISEVLEHIPNAELVMMKVKQVFSKHLLVDIPNTGFVGERLRLLLGKFPKQWAISPAEHLRFWTVDDFVFWAKQLGLETLGYYGLEDEYSSLTLGAWKTCPRLFSRYVLFDLAK